MFVNAEVNIRRHTSKRIRLPLGAGSQKQEGFDSSKLCLYIMLDQKFTKRNTVWLAGKKVLSFTVESIPLFFPFFFFVVILFFLEIVIHWVSPIVTLNVYLWHSFLISRKQDYPDFCNHDDSTLACSWHIICVGRVLCLIHHFVPESSKIPGTKYILVE